MISPKGKSARPSIAWVPAIGLGLLYLAVKGPTLWRAIAPAPGDATAPAVAAEDPRRVDDDLNAMFPKPNPADPLSAVNVDATPKTDSGREVQALMKRLMSDRKAFDAVVGEGVDPLVSNERLASPAGRSASRAQLRRIRAAAATITEQTRQYQREFVALAREAGRSLDMTREAEKTKDHETAFTALLDRAEDLLTFAEKAEPKIRKGTIVLHDQAEMDRFDALVSAFDKAGRALNAVEQRIASSLTEP